MEGTKVKLRPIIREDINILNIWRNDEETFMYLGGGFLPVSIDIQAEWMNSLIDTMGPNKRFMICDKQDQPVGMIGLYDIHHVNRTCEIGIFIGNKEAKGRGYGKEACILIEKYAREYLNIRKIKLNVVSENIKAVHLWEVLGYVKIGEFVQERFIKGEYKNVMLMEKFIGKVGEKKDS